MNIDVKLDRALRLNRIWANARHAGRYDICDRCYALSQSLNEQLVKAVMKIAQL